MVGALPAEEAAVRPAADVPETAEGVILRDHEGVPLALLREPRLVDGCLRRALEGWQRPPNRDFVELRRPPAEVRAALEGRAVVAWPLGEPPTDRKSVV